MKMMFRSACVLASLAFVAPPLLVAADDKKPAVEKSAADIAYEDFTKLHDDKEAAMDGARFQKMSAALIKFVGQNPTHKQANKVINQAVFFSGKLTGKDEALRLKWFSRLQNDLFEPLFDESMEEPNKTALIALAAGVAEGQARADVNAQSVNNLRTKIDALIQQPSGWRYLKDREAGYVELVGYLNPAVAEMYVRKLIEKSDKETTKWAKEELNFMEVRKTPFELKFTGLDGKETDFAQLRGKAVYLLFWTSDAKDFDKHLVGLLDAQDMLGKKNFAIVSVLCDKGIDAEKAKAIVKGKALKWPVYFDGQGDASELAKKLNVSLKAMPRGYLFNTEGFLVKPSIMPMDKAGGIAKQVLAPKKK